MRKNIGMLAIAAAFVALSCEKPKQCSLSASRSDAGTTAAETISCGTTEGVRNATCLTVKFSSPNAVRITELKLSVVSIGSAVSASINGTTVSFVGGVACFTGLDVPVPAGSAGVMVPIYISYPAVGVTGETSGVTSQVTLTDAQYVCGSSTDSEALSLSAPSMTLVE